MTYELDEQEEAVSATLSLEGLWTLWWVVAFQTNTFFHAQLRL